MGLESLSKGLLDYIEENEETDIEDMVSEDIADLLDVTVKHNLLSPTAGSLYSTLLNGFYIIPDFQRKFVWSQQQVAFLGLSIIKAIPIPTLYTYIEGRKEVLIDGQQRMISLFLYFNDLYVLSDFDSKTIDYKAIDALSTEYTTYKKPLDELNAASEKRELTPDEKKQVKELKKKCDAINRRLQEEYSVKKVTYEIKKGSDKVDITFSHFDEDDQEYLKQRTLYLTKIDCGLKNPQTLYMTIFGLLNRAGKLLSPQEIRNGIYWRSPLYQCLADFNALNTRWREIYGQPSKVSKDMELLLKMLALENYSEINKDGIVQLPDRLIQKPEDLEFTFNWSNIMGRFSESTQKADPKDYISKLDRFFNRIVNYIPGKKCNPAVLECLFVITTKLWDDETRTIDYSWLCSIGSGEEKTIEFPKVESNKTSVNERLKRTTTIVKELR